MDRRLALITFLIISACGGPVGPGPTDDGGPGSDAFVAHMDGGPGSDAFVQPDSGPPRCTADSQCNDHVDCTNDTCNTSSGACRFVVTPALCAAGESCNPTTGCMMGRACATSTDCADTDACTTMERCDPAARVCTFLPLDGDSDGDPPRVCGGSDCDDSLATVHSGATELCNSVDDNCDGHIDEGLDAPVCTFCATANSCHDQDMSACYVSLEGVLDRLMCTNRSTVASAIGACAAESCSAYRGCEQATGDTCACTAGRTLCGGLGGTCTDTMSDYFHCGTCARSCPLDSTCTAGNCVCTSGLVLCDSGTICVNTTNDINNCGSCGHACPSGFTCTGSACVCPTGQTACGSSCINTSNDPLNCGSCGHMCTSRSCTGGMCDSRCPGGFDCPDGRSCGSTTDPFRCGASCAACTAPANATAFCSAGGCDFTCNVGYVRSGSTCTHVCGSEFGCNPFTGAGCPTGQACLVIGSGLATCSAAGPGLNGANCGTSAPACASGLECLGDGGGTYNCMILCCGPGDDARCRSPALGGVPTSTCSVILSGAGVYVCSP